MKVVSTPPHCSFFLPLCLGKGRKGERERRGRQREREREREREKGSYIRELRHLPRVCL
jgi:hypothetical protein